MSQTCRRRGSPGSKLQPKRAPGATDGGTTAAFALSARATRGGPSARDSQGRLGRGRQGAEFGSRCGSVTRRGSVRKSTARGSGAGGGGDLTLPEGHRLSSHSGFGPGGVPGSPVGAGIGLHPRPPSNPRGRLQGELTHKKRTTSKCSS